MHAAAPPTTSIKTLRIMLIAMIAGILAFGIVACLLAPLGGDDSQLANVLLLVLALMAVGELSAYVVIRMVILGKLRQAVADSANTDDPQTLVLPVFYQITIIGAAMAEGLSLFGLVIFLLFAAPPALIAPVLGVVLIAARFPSENKLANFTLDVTGRQPIHTFRSPR